MNHNLRIGHIRSTYGHLDENKLPLAFCLDGTVYSSTIKHNITTEPLLGSSVLIIAFNVTSLQCTQYKEIL